MRSGLTGPIEILYFVSMVALSSLAVAAGASAQHRPAAQEALVITPGEVRAPAHLLAQVREPQSDVAQSNALTRDQIAAVQRRLRTLGLNPGPADGRMGAQTRTAIRHYQALTGLEMNGHLSPALLAHLFPPGLTNQRRTAISRTTPPARADRVPPRRDGTAAPDRATEPAASASDRALADIIVESRRVIASVQENVDKSVAEFLARAVLARTASKERFVFGEGRPVGNGSARTYVELTRNGDPVAYGVAFTLDMLEGLPEEPSRSDRCLDLNKNGEIELPDECVGDQHQSLDLPEEFTDNGAGASPRAFPGAIQWVDLTWRPDGLVPQEFSPAHFEFHFYIAEIEEIHDIRMGD